MFCEQHQKLSISENRVILFFFYNRIQFLRAHCQAVGLILLMKVLVFEEIETYNLVVAEIELKRENK